MPGLDKDTAGIVLQYCDEVPWAKELRGRPIRQWAWALAWSLSTTELEPSGWRTCTRERFVYSNYGNPGKLYQMTYRTWRYNCHGKGRPESAPAWDQNAYALV
jgi:hypothetical protein